MLVTCDRSVVFLLVFRFVFSTNNADRYDITEILLKVALKAPSPNSRFANFRFQVCIEVYVKGVSILLPNLRLFLLLNFGNCSQDMFLFVFYSFFNDVNEFMSILKKENFMFDIYIKNI